MRETAHHQRAFEVYFAMGADRSLSALAAKLGVSQASAKLWSRKFGWAGRIAERNRTVAELVERKSTKQEVDRKVRNRQIVQAGIIATARAIADGKIRPTLSDLDRMIRLESHLESEGDPEGVTTIVVEWPKALTSSQARKQRDEEAELRDSGDEG